MILTLKQENELLEAEIRKIKIQNLDNSLGLRVNDRERVNGIEKKEERKGKSGKR